VDHGGDFLLEIFHSPFCTQLEVDKETGSGSGRIHPHYARVPAMLLYDSEDASDFTGHPNRGVNRDYISYLLQLTRDVKQNPVRLTHLLIQLAKADLEYLSEFEDPQCILDLGNVVEVVRKYCLGNGGTSYIKGSHDLALLLTKWRDSLGESWEEFWEEPEYAMREGIGPDELTMRCTQVIHGLVAPRVTRFGLRASRSIACARPVVAADAGTGWMRMDDDRTGWMKVDDDRRGLFELERSSHDSSDDTSI
jgi:hypothetical protein